MQTKETHIINKIKDLSRDIINSDFEPILIGKGSKTHVYKISEDHVIKLNTQDPRYIVNEKKLIQLCNKNGLNVPEIIKTGNFEFERKNRKDEIEVKNVNYGIQKLSRGKELTSDSVCEAIFLELSKDLRKLHEIKMEGFGRLSFDVFGDYPTWKSYLKTHVKEEFLPVITETLSKETEWAMGFLENLDYNDARFCFGDLKFDHIFVENNKYVNLLDFDYCLAGDPLYDFAVYDFYCDFNWKYYKTKKWIRYEGLNEKRIREYKRLIAIKKVGVYALDDRQELSKRAQQLATEYFK